MAVTHSTATRNAATDAVVDRVDLGTGTSSGRCRLKTAGDATLVDLVLSNPAFGAASGGAAALAAVTDTAATGTGTAAKFDFLDRDGNVVFSGTVTATGGGGDMTVDNTSIAAGQVCDISGYSYSALSD